MQKRPPPVRHKFAEKADLSSQQKLERRLEKLSDSDQQLYHKVCSDQARALEYFREDLEESREFKVERLAQDILNQKQNEPKPINRPRFLKTYSRGSLVESARDEAEIKVSMDVEARLSMAKARHAQERYDLLTNLEYKKKCLIDFRKSSEGRSKGSERDEGRER